MNEVAIITPKTFEAIEPKMQQAGFSVETVKREISFAVQAINKSQQLQKCSPASLMQAVMNISNIGLTLNPAAKEAYLIPRWNNLSKSMEAVLEPGYVGLVKLLTDAGSVKSMLCQLVYEKDKFLVDLANNSQPVQHLPELSRTERGSMKGAYALATLIDGTRQVEYMSLEEIHDIRERSETYKAFMEQKIKSCTWASDFGEMARKTVIKRIYKYLPRTERMQQVDKAIEIDNSDFGVSDDQISYIDSLLHTCTLDEKIKELIEMEIPVMSAKRASEVIGQLQQAQPHDALKSVQKEARRQIQNA